MTTTQKRVHATIIALVLAGFGSPSCTGGDNSVARRDPADIDVTVE